MDIPNVISKMRSLKFVVFIRQYRGIEIKKNGKRGAYITGRDKLRTEPIPKQEKNFDILGKVI